MAQDYAAIAAQARKATPATDYAALAERARRGGAAPATTADAPISSDAEQQLQRTDLPDDVRAEVEAIRTGTAPNTLTNTGAVVNAWGEHGPHAVVQGLRDLLAGNFSRGAHEVITGAGITAAPMIAPALLPAVAAAPGATALTVGGGAAAQHVASAVASEAGATPDQAALAGDVGSLGVGAAIAKVGVPMLARWSTTRKASQMGADYMQSTRDIQSALGVSAEDVHRARPFLETVHNNGIPITGKEDAVAQFVKAANVAVDEIEQHIGGLVQQFPTAQTPAIGQVILRRVARMPGVSAADRAAALKVIADYGLNKPRSLADSESLRIRLNAENRSTLEGSGVRQRNAVLTNPVYVARQEAANQLRDEIYGALEQRGVQGIRDLRLSEGSIIALRDKADPLTRGLRGESTVARTGETSLPRRLVQRVAPAVGAGAGASIGGPPGAAVGAELGRDLTYGLTTKNMSKNALLERAFRQSFTSSPVMSVQRIVPRGPGQSATSGRPRLPPPSLPSASTGPALPPAPPAPPAQLGPGARPMPAPENSGVTGAPAKSIVVRDPRTGRMRRIYISEAK